MKTCRTTASWLIAGSLLLIGVAGIPSVCMGQEPPDLPFVETDYQGLEDMRTHLVWGKDINVMTGVVLPDAYVESYYNREDSDGDQSTVSPLPVTLTGGFTDWRLPTVGEVLEAIDNGLLDHMDFSYRAGHQGLDAVMDRYMGDENGLTYRTAYFWATCKDRWKNMMVRYRVRFSDGTFGGGSSGGIIAVRGQHYNHSNCPGRHAEPFDPEPQCYLTINDVSKREGKAGETTVFTFTVTRTGDLFGPVRANFSTEDGTASDADDYVGASGAILFGTDDSTMTIDLTVNGDSVKETDEYFLVTLTTEMTGATITDFQGIGTIRNDDRK